MQSECKILINNFFISQFFLFQPPLIGKRELHLVPVIENFFRRYNRFYFKISEAAHLLENLFNLLLFEFQLYFIIKVLLFAPSAKSEVPASCRYPEIGRNNNFNHLRFSIGILYFKEHYFDSITGI